MIRFFVLIVILFTLSSCAEVEYASHLAKTTGGWPARNSASTPPVGQGGNFKIGKPYKIDGRWYYPKEQYEMTETGIISWYGPGFHNKKTANGEIFNKNELTAAHRTLQMPSLVRVTNLENGRSIIVRVNDRGPYKRGRVMDVSERAAELLGFKSNGTAKAKIEVLKKESWSLAQAAKNGQSTQGAEVAMNEGGGFQPASYEPGLGPGDTSYRMASVEAEPLADLPPAIEPVNREMLATPGAQPGLTNIVPGHVNAGAFYPDPVVSEFPVRPTGIYVQAGSFSVEDNARALSARLGNYRHADVYPAMINGQRFYRVRLGPLSNVEEADELLARVIQGGQNSAIIVVE
ncbi:MAG TPA: septal ring lytic transglycosylase RlpA family protein [Micavibrio sp.]